MADREVKLILRTFKEGAGIEETAKAIRELEKKAADLKKIMEQGGITHKQYLSALNEMGLKTKENIPLIDKMKSSFSALLPAISAIAVIAGLKSMSDAAKNYAESVDKMTDITGVSAEQASKWVVQANHVGVSADTVANGMALLSRNLVNNNDAFQRFNITTKDANGALLPLEKILAQVRDREKEMGAGAKTTAMEMEIFGRSGKELHDFLSADNAEMERTNKLAADLGIVLDDVNSQGLEQMNRNLNDLKLVQIAVGMKLNQVLLPLLIFLEGQLIRVAEGWNKIFDLPAIVKGQMALNETTHEVDKLLKKQKELTEAIMKDGKNASRSQIKELQKVTREINDHNDQLQKRFKEIKKDEVKITKEVHDFNIGLSDEEKDKLIADQNKIAKEHIDLLKVRAGHDLLYFQELLAQEQSSTAVKSAQWNVYQLEVEKVQQQIITKNREATIAMVNDYSHNFFDGVLQGQWSIEGAFDRMKTKTLKIWEDMIADMVTKWIASDLLNLPIGTSSGGGGGGGSRGGIGGALSGAARGAAIGSVVPVVGNIVGGIIGGIAGLFGFAEGGIVTKPSLGIVGEAGPEAIIPLSKAGGFGETNINIYTMAYTGDDKSIRALAREIDKAMWKEKRVGRTVNA